MSGDSSGYDAHFVCVGLVVCLVLATLFSVYDDYEVGGKHYKIVEVTVNTQYKEVVK